MRSVTERRVDDVRRPLRLHLRETLAEGGSDRFVEFREEVAVAVERHADRAVAQSALDRLRVRAGRNGECHARVPQVMESTAHTRTGECRLEEVRVKA